MLCISPLWSNLVESVRIEGATKMDTRIFTLTPFRSSPGRNICVSITVKIRRLWQGVVTVARVGREPLVEPFKRTVLSPPPSMYARQPEQRQKLSVLGLLVELDVPLIGRQKRFFSLLPAPRRLSELDGQLVVGFSRFRLGFAETHGSYIERARRL
jgi:hypothetical protein